MAKKDEKGNIVGIWGAMSDFSRSFKPWENFDKGLYLAGVECADDVEAPSGWTKWIILHWLVQFTILPARRQGRIICIFRLESYR